MIKAITILCVMLMLAACGRDQHNSENKKTKIVTVKPHALTTALYYSGIVQPLNTVVITAPTDGVVSDMKFHYGDVVTAGQLLFTLTSEKFQADYKDALMAYVKAKTEFTNQQSLLSESEFLYKNQLISMDDYKAKKTNFFNAQLGFIQAKDVLAVYLKRLAINDVDLFSLSIENVEKINQLLHGKQDAQVLQVASPAAGVILLPIKNDNSDNQSKKTMKGDQVKQGDVLAMIGDVSGLTIHINVNEYNVNELKIGQAVKVTGTAFSGLELQGAISSIDRQGQTSQGGTPVFPVEVVVSKLSPEAQKSIHMGMSAKVEILLQGPEVITVPIAAVIQKNGASYLRVKTENKVKEVLVKTGQTTQDEVVISSNLNAGDRVVITG
jgi:multidrug efflux pump subunit AcrA (membrane-fusion protein)